MNFQPNFEQYKKDQEQIEKIPTVNTEIHFQINDLVQKMIIGEHPSQEEFASCEIVFSMLQDLDREIVSFVERLRVMEVLTKEESLIVITIFLVSKQIGPDIQLLHDAFLKQISQEYFETLVDTISLPEHTKSFLKVVHQKTASSYI